MEKIKVLVLDQDILARQAMSNVLSLEPGIKVMMSNGHDQVEREISNENPDVVLINLDESEEDGFTLFNTIRVRFPSLPVVVSLSRSEKGAETAMYVLRKGAFDFITKPEQYNILLFATRHFMKRLPPMIKAAANSAKAINRIPTPDHIQYELRNVKSELRKGEHDMPIRLVTIGSCSGGPKVLLSIFKQIPAGFPVPIVVVQHFPKIFTKKLARVLDKYSNITVQEVYDGAELRAGTAWIAPGGYQCELQQAGANTLLRTHRGPRVNGVRPSIDVLFKSTGRLYGRQVLGVVLSGCGIDSLSGARAIKSSGGEIFIQDPDEALAPEMPLNIMQAGLADQVYTSDELGRQITSRALKYYKNHEGLDDETRGRPRIKSGSLDAMEFNSL